MFKVREKMEDSREIYPEVRVEEIFAEICKENSIWRIDEKSLGVETSRVFRAASMKKLRPFPQSIRLIEHCINIPKCIISNGQRVFSELELRFLGLYDYFDFVIFSSDVRYKKPDLRLFMTALKKMNLELEPRPHVVRHHRRRHARRQRHLPRRRIHRPVRTRPRHQRPVHRHLHPQRLGKIGYPRGKEDSSVLMYLAMMQGFGIAGKLCPVDG